ncbi:tetratricopeptide repeat protein [Antarcticimicrobium luteum]|uniref:Tetratricopeptide repeat protein n=1 Tax=Antarcticimicrobium luteum TaxID=2547397 RepID=A0A4R5UT71_9RHOB|nr:tetratricopeptide repeat protein [Antarcticimicrobium luteum]TDK42322.1 tetratricopeptide repeat protein [Antarcticimicrobium luteum]
MVQQKRQVLVKSLVRRAAAALVLAAIALPAPLVAQSGTGGYLAGRHALFESDFDQAASYFTRALSRDPGNAGLMENVIVSQLALGRIQRALPVAEKMEADGLRNQAARMVIAADRIKRGEFAPFLEADNDAGGIGPLVDGLLAGWAYMGTGSVAQALERFDQVAKENGLRSFALYHKALALAMVGDFEGAEALYADRRSGLSGLSRRAVIARAQILSQLGRNDEALEMMTDAFGAGFDPGLTAVADQLAAGGQLPFDLVGDVSDGMAEVFFSVGAALKGEAADDYALIYVRIASYLRPDHIDALLLSADLLDGLGQYDLAVETYKQVPVGSPDRHAAELGRADALRRADKPNAAIEVLEQLARDYPTLPMVHNALGDLLRQQEDYKGAVAAYDKALEYTEEGAPSQWFILYARGISHERLDQWPEAEADFRRALELNPDQPQVLNYLGYSLVEKQEKLDEALDMIERAVAARPDSGFIVDSLGWVLFRLGRYQEAVSHMETAVELMPVDPVVTDHLGDVYWAVGRQREAEFQWRRALSFIDLDDADGEADPDRIRRKLAVGLDTVLAEEGAAPLKVANGD